MSNPFLAARIDCPGCGRTLDVIYRAPPPMSEADAVARMIVNIAGLTDPISSDATNCPDCGADIRAAIAGGDPRRAK